MTTENEFSCQNKNICSLNSRLGELDFTDAFPLTGKHDLEQARCFTSAQYLCFSILLTPV